MQISGSAPVVQPLDRAKSRFLARARPSVPTRSVSPRQRFFRESQVAGNPAR